MINIGEIRQTELEGFDEDLYYVKMFRSNDEGARSLDTFSETLNIVELIEFLQGAKGVK